MRRYGADRRGGKRGTMEADSTTQLQHLIDRINAGDGQAREELIGRACDRLRRLTAKILQDYRRLKRFEDEDDVLQNVVLRLMRRLRAVSVTSVADFFYLAAREIRLELIDLARRYYGPSGKGTKEKELEIPSDSSNPNLPAGPANTHHEPSHLALWSELHEHAQSLPAMERCVFDLLWYHEMTQEEAAAVLNCSVATVKRYWVSARERLREFVEKERAGA